jgi:hypothetical protein
VRKMGRKGKEKGFAKHFHATVWMTLRSFLNQILFLSINYLLTTIQISLSVML